MYAQRPRLSFPPLQLLVDVDQRRLEMAGISESGEETRKFEGPCLRDRYAKSALAGGSIGMDVVMGLEKRVRFVVP
jgi:hypothetical protein